MGALVSIIIPVYNLEGYINNCLKSLVNQTYQNIEILCIDDGSADKSAEIIRSFAHNDSRILYVHKHNGGVSSARNLGLDIFKGEYVMFVDGDDYLHPQAVELFVSAMNEMKCDIVCAELEKATDYITEFNVLKNIGFRKVRFNDLCLDESNRLSSSSCSKLYKREVISKFRFNCSIAYGEDTNFVFKAFSDDPEIVKIDEHLYYYYTRENSAETSVFNLNRASVIDAYDDICDFYSAKSDSDAKIFALKYIYNAIFYTRTLCIGTEYEKEVLKKCKVIGKKWMIPLLKQSNISIKDKALNFIFFHSRPLYELARVIVDPTMKEFYKHRRKHNG